MVRILISPVVVYGNIESGYMSVESYEMPLSAFFRSESDFRLCGQKSQFSRRRYVVGGVEYRDVE